jgi:transcriptional regulator with XRE-family HTH domain
MVFTEKLRRLRLERFLPQRELARRAGLHAVTLTRLEGGTAAPSTRSVRALADALGVEPRELATPGEVAELRGVLRGAAQADSITTSPLDTWSDDGGAVETETSLHAARGRS